MPRTKAITQIHLRFLSAYTAIALLHWREYIQLSSSIYELKLYALSHWISLLLLALLAVFVCFSAYTNGYSFGFIAFWTIATYPILSNAGAKPRHANQVPLRLLKARTWLSPAKRYPQAFLAKSPQVAPALILAFIRCFLARKRNSLRYDYREDTFIPCWPY